VAEPLYAPAKDNQYPLEKKPRWSGRCLAFGPEKPSTPQLPLLGNGAPELWKNPSPQGYAPGPLQRFYDSIALVRQPRTDEHPRRPALIRLPERKHRRPRRGLEPAPPLYLLRLRRGFALAGGTRILWPRGVRGDARVVLGQAWCGQVGSTAGGGDWFKGESESP